MIIKIVIYILGEGANPNLPKCKKKKLLRIEKKLAKNPNYTVKNSKPEQKSLEDFIAENDSVSTDEIKKLRVRSYNNCNVFIFSNMLLLIKM